MTPALELADVVRHYRLRRFLRPAERVRAVDGVSFAVEPGESFGLVGESGCGKTTVGRLVLGLLRPTAGSIRVDGADVGTMSAADLRKLRRRAQMIHQDPLNALDPRMPVGAQIAEGLAIHGIGTPAERTERAAAMMAAVGLAARLSDRYPHELSGGQQQRVVIARALLLEPSLVVCDEPVSALDVSVQAQVVNLLGELQGRYGCAYLFISHNLAVVRHICRRIAVMYLGTVVEVAGRDELFERPRHPYTRALIAAVPVPDPSRRGRRSLPQGEPPSPTRPPTGCRFHPRCALAVERCRIEAPALLAESDGHAVACHRVAEGEI
jgi:oligopeptide/dipeptide ABC transporter ATP-binding protein